MKMYRTFIKKLPKFSQILGMLNNNFKPILVQKFLSPRTKAYNELHLPILLYESEIWALRKNDNNDGHQSR